MIFKSLAARPTGLKGLKYLVVGSGFYGSVIAERIAAAKGLRVVVVEKRDHIGGNSYSEKDPATGIECHRYGSHIFHTGSKKVWEYMLRFCSFNNYRHRVLTRYRNRVYQLPVNLSTINAFYGLNLDAAEAHKLLRTESRKEHITAPANLEQKAVSMIGRPLYTAFVRGYTEKQWGRHPRRLPPDIIARLPVRFDNRSGYFSDRRQGIPLEGYGRLFGKMLSHRNIDVYLNTDFFEIRNLVPKTCRIIYTGRIDRYFDYAYGRLGWRGLRFEREIMPAGDFQGTAVMNYAAKSVPYTRIHEFRHLHPERAYIPDRTVIAREYPEECGPGGDPAYPVNTHADREALARYLVGHIKSCRVIFGGRLGTYRYLDMDQTIKGALETYESKIKNVSE